MYSKQYSIIKINGIKSLVIKLTEKCHAPKNPVLDRLVSGQFEGQDIVCGVASGGEDTTPCTGLVERTHILTSILNILLVDYIR